MFQDYFFTCHWLPFFCRITAHNKLSGTIPLSLQIADFNELDLSYNRLTGEYNHGEHGHNDHDPHEEEDDPEDEDSHHVEMSTMMILQVNRLSGPLDETAYTFLRILNGNLFGCDFIPGEDEHSDTYACGKIIIIIVAYILLASFDGGFVLQGQYY